MHSGPVKAFTDRYYLKPLGDAAAKDLGMCPATYDAVKKMTFGYHRYYAQLESYEPFVNKVRIWLFCGSAMSAVQIYLTYSVNVGFPENRRWYAKPAFVGCEPPPGWQDIDYIDHRSDENAVRGINHRIGTNYFTPIEMEYCV